MNFTGLLKKFKVNRLLSKEEENCQLLPNRNTGTAPLPRRSVIQMNSNALEICDKFFFDRGLPTAFGTYGICLFLGGLLSIIILFTKDNRWVDIGAILSVAFMSIITLVVVFSTYYVLVSRECFRYTHYPIIFNRKTRKVHVFRFDGTVMTEDWDKIYFTLGEEHMLGTRDIRGHRLAEDRKTVLETFSLPYYDHTKNPSFFAMWEFVRQFMEVKDSPAFLAPKVTSLLGVDKKRLGYWQALWLSHKYDLEAFGPLIWIGFLPKMIYVVGRWIADRTSKIPQWPPEIAVELVPDANDPYVVNEESMKKAREKMTASPS